MILNWIVNRIIDFFKSIFSNPSTKEKFKQLLFETLIIIINQFFNDKVTEHTEDYKTF